MRLLSNFWSADSYLNSTTPGEFWPYITRYLPYLETSDLIGVEGSTVYDILSDNNGTGAVAVGAATFNVTCGSLPNTTTTGAMQDFNYNGYDGDYMWSLETTLGDDTWTYTADVLREFFVSLIDLIKDVLRVCLASYGGLAHASSPQICDQSNNCSTDMLVRP